jgi:uncharacterized membrane protein
MAETRISLNSNALKIIAIVAMFFDHFLAVFMSHDTVIGLMLRLPGTIAAPTFCYFVAEGYHYTSNKSKYIKRVLIFALISHLPYNIYFGYTFFEATSVIWGLAMGLIALTAIKSEKLNIVAKLLILVVCCILATTANWNYIAVLWIVVFGLYQGDFKRQMIGFSIVAILFHLIPTYLRFGPIHEGFPHWYQVGVFLAIPLLATYNGKRGKKSKIMSWSFYVFYPAHLILLFLLDRFTSLSTLLR